VAWKGRFFFWTEKGERYQIFSAEP